MQTNDALPRLHFDTLDEVLAAYLRAVLAAERVDIGDLANMLGITRYRASCMYHGRQPMSGSQLVRVARWLGMTSDGFVGRAEQWDARC